MQALDSRPKLMLRRRVGAGSEGAWRLDERESSEDSRSERECWLSPLETRAKEVGSAGPELVLSRDSIMDDMTCWFAGFEATWLADRRCFNLRETDAG